ncbi:MAG: ABC transporter ATP-binding protein [Clostridia bacterium]|nr:ABC transporter ATP-binding protein [Clostridia bacterium]
MEQAYAIRVKDVQKKFKVFLDKRHTLTERLLFRASRQYEERHVLNGVSFDVRRGEAVGLVGQNGCGKSTMLKLISRIMYPDAGSVELNGRVSSLIELGAGFHQDMSGRENIYINASIFGLKKHEIDERLPEIIAFSELEDYIDNPVRTYSSGMYMRLAFSVAINVNADILLIDEILAVGDAAFQAKCFNKLREIKGRGVTIVIVSHSLGQIEQFCERSIWLKDGHVELIGPPGEVHPLYLDYMGKKGDVILDGSVPETAGRRWGSKAVEITAVYMQNAAGRRQTAYASGEAFDIVMTYRRNDPALQKTVAGFGVFRNDNLQMYGSNTRIDHLPQVELAAEGRICCHISGNSLMQGEYVLDVALHSEDEEPYDFWRGCLRFSVYAQASDVGLCRLTHAWAYAGAPEQNSGGQNNG